MSVKSLYHIDEYKLGAPTPLQMSTTGDGNSVQLIILHDSGISNKKALDVIDLMKKGQVHPAHIIIDDSHIFECIDAVLTNPRELVHPNFSKSLKYSQEVIRELKTLAKHKFLGYNPIRSAIHVSICFGEQFENDIIYRHLIWLLAKICKTYDLSPDQDIVGHHFLDSPNQIDPLSALTIMRKSYDQLKKDTYKFFDAWDGSDWLPTYFNQIKSSIVKEQGEVEISLQELHVRKSIPSTLSSSVRKLKKGEIVKYQGWTKQGDYINGNSLWLQDLNGDFFWAGGVVKKKSIKRVDYNNMHTLQIPDAWQQTKGENVRVAVVDFGFDLSAPGLRHLNKDGRKFDASRSDFANSKGNDIIATSTTHGSECVSLIASSQEGESIGIQGIAPKAELYFFKITTRLDYYWDEFLRAIKKAVALKAHIISFSGSLPRPTAKEKKAFVKSLTWNDGIQQSLFVASAENSYRPTTLDNLAFPANSPATFSVAGITENFMLNYNLQPFTKLEYALYTKKEIYLTRGVNQVTDFSSSYATALFSGLLALYLSHYLESVGNFSDLTKENICGEIEQVYNSLEAESPVLTQTPSASIALVTTQSQIS